MKTRDIKTETTTDRELTMSNDISNYKKLMTTIDEPIGLDFQGWPLYQLRVISLLRVLGIDDDVIKQIPEDTLKQHIIVGQDDSMGYIVDTNKVTDATITKDGLCLIY